jgi:hypothetical protein
MNALKFIRESGAVIIDGYVIQVKVGTELNVEFDFMAAWEIIKCLPKQFRMLRLIHVHPDGIQEPSRQDWLVLKAWQRALGSKFMVTMEILTVDGVRTFAPEGKEVNSAFSNEIFELLIDLSYLRRDCYWL